MSVNNIPPFAKGSCEKIQTRDGKASPLVPGREKFTTPKPAGDTELRGIPSSSAMRRRQSEDHFRKTKGFSFRLSPSSIHRRQRRIPRLFWRREFFPPRDIARSLLFHSLNFFTASGGRRGDLRRAFQKSKFLPPSYLAFQYGNVSYEFPIPIKAI